MTAVQMSKEFDLLWNNIMSNQAPGLTVSEKEKFLNKAQDEVVKNYLVRQSQGNMLQAGVEDIAKRQADFSKLTVVATSSSGTGTKQHPHGSVFAFPSNALMILSETAGNLSVLPITSEEFLRLMSKPYKYPLKGQCWRLMGNNNNVELVAPSGTSISSYTVRYIKKPSAISISTPTDPEVSESLHEDIVQRAVELAKATWSSSDNFVAMGRRTE